MPQQFHHLAIRALILTAWAFALVTLSVASVAAPRSGIIAPRTEIESIVLIHFAPEPKVDPEKAIVDLLRKKHTFFARRSSEVAAKGGNSVFIEYIDLKAKNFLPPSVRSIERFGKGVSTVEAQALQNSSHALVLMFAYSDRDVLKAIDEISRLVLDVATETGGLIWDDEARLLYATSNWKEARIQSTSDGFPDISRHISIHQYKNTEFVRSISLGLQKFGLPDLVVEDHSWSLDDEMSNVISLLAQSILEGRHVPWSGNFDLQVKDIRNRNLRERVTRVNRENATGVGYLWIKEGRRDKGDADNDLLEIAFTRYPGKEPQERQSALASTMFGWTDSVTNIKHNEAILAESERAKKKFEALRPRFNAGFAPGERVIVKAPFKTPKGGNEWMWVEVNKWNGDSITGLLGNEPELVPGLHVGAKVTVKQSEIFDYVWYKSDGTEEGNETGKLIERASK